MKKILLILVLSIFLIPNVNASTEITVTYEDIVTIPSHLVHNNYQYLYQDFDTFILNENNKAIFDTLYTELYETYISNYSKTYPYYLVSVAISSTSLSSFEFDKLGITMYLYTNIPEDYNNKNYSLYGTYQNSDYCYCNSDNNSNCSYWNFYFSPIVSVSAYNVASYAPTFFFASNFEVSNSFIPTYSVSVIDKMGNTFHLTNTIPVMNNYLFNDAYIEVNLDNYEYVILNLKDYSSRDAFDTNLKVKGMIGITPVYEFGTTEKETITDRCNITYSNYTNYRLYVLKNDLINNSVYYVKACEKNSSFKFISSIFNITYVTADNVDDPVITFGGQDYHTIPFNKLSNSANQNEANNFIPGESTDGSITTVIDSITEYISNFWNGLVTFMGLVTKFFNTLPIEIRAISITAFSTGLTLGIIKFIKS